MDAQAVMVIYEEISYFTNRMLGAASDNDWDSLESLERECSSRIAILQEYDNDANMLLTEEEHQKKMDLIRKILDDDRQIREITEPWMRKLSELINHSSVSRKLNQTYGRSQAG